MTPGERTGRGVLRIRHAPRPGRAVVLEGLRLGVLLAEAAFYGFVRGDMGGTALFLLGLPGVLLAGMLLLLPPWPHLGLRTILLLAAVAAATAALVFLPFYGWSAGTPDGYPTAAWLALSAAVLGCAVSAAWQSMRSNA